MRTVWMVAVLGIGSVAVLGQSYTDPAPGKTIGGAGGEKAWTYTAPPIPLVTYSTSVHGLLTMQMADPLPDNIWWVETFGSGPGEGSLFTTIVPISGRGWMEQTLSPTGPEDDVNGISNTYGGTLELTVPAVVPLPVPSMGLDMTVPEMPQY